MKKIIFGLIVLISTSAHATMSMVCESASGKTQVTVNYGSTSGKITHTKLPSDFASLSSIDFVTPPAAEDQALIIENLNGKTVFVATRINDETQQRLSIYIEGESGKVRLKSTERNLVVRVTCQFE
jgi:predicted GH43/DUF377 family glycosyl hydrolase